MKKILTLLALSFLIAGAAMAADYYTKEDYRNGVPAPALTAGTDTCAAPTAIGAVPFNDTGDTTGATSVIDAVPAACNGNYTAVAGEDHIYTFTTGGGAGNLTFATTTTDPEYDMSIYVVTTCTDGNTCVSGADACFAVNAGGNPCGAVSDETIAAQAYADGTYFFFVDSFYTVGNTAGRSAGPYTVDVTGTLPVTLLDFSVE